VGRPERGECDPQKKRSSEATLRNAGKALSIEGLSGDQPNKAANSDERSASGKSDVGSPVRIFTPAARRNKRTDDGCHESDETCPVVEQPDGRLNSWRASSDSLG
jgi:hypothetical protein